MAGGAGPDQSDLRDRKSTTSSSPDLRHVSKVRKVARRRANTSANERSPRPPLPGIQELLQGPDSASSYRNLSRDSREDSPGEHGSGRRVEWSEGQVGRFSSQVGQGDSRSSPSTSVSSAPAWIPPNEVSNTLIGQETSSSRQGRRLSFPSPPPLTTSSSFSSPAPSKQPLLREQSSSMSFTAESRPAGVVAPAPCGSIRSSSIQSDFSESSGASSGDPIESDLGLISKPRETSAARSSQKPTSEREELSDEMVEPKLERALLMDASAEPRRFELFIRQSPLSGRASGSGGKERRPLDPLPIVQLKIMNSQGDFDPDDLAHTSPNLVLRASLKSAEDSSERDHFKILTEDDSQFARALEGKNFASAHVCKDLDDSKACFFIFPDLSVKVEGRFVLCFSLIRLGRSISSSTPPNSSIAGELVQEVLSDPFKVYSSKKYPGMMESSQLVKLLAAQNVSIPVRNDVRKGRE